MATPRRPAPPPLAKAVARGTLSGALGGLPKPVQASKPRPPRPGKPAMHHPPPATPAKPRPARPAKPRAPIFGKPNVKVPSSLAGELKPLSIKPIGSRPRKLPPRPR